MKIPPKCTLHCLPDRNRSVKTPAPSSPQSAERPPKRIERDTVSLSGKGRNVHIAAPQEPSIPEIREDRVMRLKRQIEEGAYRIAGDRIAADMMDETLENNTLLKKIDTNA